MKKGPARQVRHGPGKERRGQSRRAWRKAPESTADMRTQGEGKIGTLWETPTAEVEFAAKEAGRKRTTEPRD